MATATDKKAKYNEQVDINELTEYDSEEENIAENVEKKDAEAKKSDDTYVASQLWIS